MPNKEWKSRTHKGSLLWLSMNSIAHMGFFRNSLTRGQVSSMPSFYPQSLRRKLCVGISLATMDSEGDPFMIDDCEWTDSTYLSMVEDDSIFGPEGVYGWFMNIWYRFWA
jgi:hypothetical protein